MIIICGANHSGTSYTAKTLLDNGFTTGKWDKNILPVLGYHTYEDLKFREIAEVGNDKSKSKQFLYYYDV